MKVGVLQFFSWPGRHGPLEQVYARETVLLGVVTNRDYLLAVVAHPAFASGATHTEFLAERVRVSQVVMMLVGGGLRVALATTAPVSSSRALLPRSPRVTTRTSARRP